MDNEQNAKRLEEIAADMETCGICGPDVPLVLKSAALWRERDGVRWSETTDAMRSRAIVIYRDRFACAEQHEGCVACWWATDKFNERGVKYFDTAPTLDAAKAAAIAWVDAQEAPCKS